MLGDVGIADLHGVARVHLASFPVSAMTRLGREAVRRYYLWQLEGPHEHYFRGAWEDGGLVGFCVSGISRGALAGYLRANRAYLGVQLLLRPWLWGSELVRERVRTALRSLGRRRHPGEGLNAAASTGPRSWGILSIAVHPAVQGKGVAQLLMMDAEEEARRRGFSQLHLTVATENHRAVRFYEKLGWRKDPDEASWAGRMVKVVGRDVDAR